MRAVDTRLTVSVGTLCAWLAFTTLGSIAAEALTLDEYFVHALARSEVIATQAELIHQAEERYRQARAARGPAVDGVATYTWLDRGARDSTANPTRQPHARLTATQPLFRGFREFATLRQTQALIDAQSEDYRQARTQLFRDVAQNFYDVLALEQDLINLGEQINHNLEREKELHDRVRIGRSRAGETLTVQSTISALRAQVEELRAQLAVAREAFAFLSGLPVATPLHDDDIPSANLESLEIYLARVEARPDMQAAQQRLTAARENIAVARGARQPSLDLNANRYLERKGNLEDVDWDVQLALTIPLYSGGSLQSQEREAVSQFTQAELSASQARRQAEQEIRSLYQSVTSGRARVAALERAMEAARKNYEVQRRDYRLGLVTNLEVIQSLTDFQETQRALDRARYAVKLDYLRLQAAAALRPRPSDTPAP